MRKVIVLKRDAIFMECPLGERCKVQDEIIEIYPTLTKLCDANPEFSYNYLKSKKFPFTYKGYEFIKKEL
jgi:hypothetical protein